MRPARTTSRRWPRYALWLFGAFALAIVGGLIFFSVIEVLPGWAAFVVILACLVSPRFMGRRRR